MRLQEFINKHKNKLRFFKYILSIVFVVSFSVPTHALEPCQYMQDTIDELIINNQDITDYYLDSSNWYSVNYEYEKSEQFRNKYNNDIYPKIQDGTYKYLTLKKPKPEGSPGSDLFFILIDTNPSISSLPFRFKSNSEVSIEQFSSHYSNYDQVLDNFGSKKWLVLYMSSMTNVKSKLRFNGINQNYLTDEYLNQSLVLSSSTINPDDLTNDKCQLIYLNLNSTSDSNNSNITISNPIDSQIKIFSVFATFFISYLIIKSFSFKGRV